MLDTPDKSRFAPESTAKTQTISRSDSPKTDFCRLSGNDRLTHRHLGRDFRLIDVHGNVVKEILA